jgi:hypothetical protein
MKRTLVVWLLAASALPFGTAFAEELEPTPSPARPVHALGAKARASGVAAYDTAWIGHKLDGTANPATDWLDVHKGGVWDFDTDIAGTDSTQGVRRMLIPYASSLAFAITPSTSRPIQLAIDHGNVINEGNTSLWNARDAASRKYRRTGIAGAWHSDPLGIGAPAVAALNGSRSAWCGLRAAGDNSQIDALTGNPINADHVMLTSGTTVINSFPGYGNGWDQLMYKDFTADGSGGGSVTFNYRTELNTYVDTVLLDVPPPTLLPGAGWFNPNPTDLANFVQDPADSFMVYVGTPTELAYDTNRRWLDEIIDLSGHYQELFARSGTSSATGHVAAFSGFAPNAPVRVVFRVKTNRVRSDSGTTGAYNTQAGAAIVDQVSVTGDPTVYGFETAGSVTARSLAGDVQADGGPWVTTGKPPSHFFHVHNVASLIYEDVCGQVGSPGRICGLEGNVIAIGNHDEANHVITTEISEVFEFPTIDLSNRTGGPGAPGTNAQGITTEEASRPWAVLDFDVYSGQLGLDQGVFYRKGVRVYRPGFYKQAVTGENKWSEVITGGIIYNPDKECYRDLGGASSFVAWGTVDSLRVVLSVISMAYQWAVPGSEGDTRGTYFDNVRVGLVEGNPIGSTIWHQFQDQFPTDESVAPGDTDAFAVLTANLRSGQNIAANGNPQSVVPGDSLIFQAAYWSGNGSTTGTRMDFVFRIDPGPANYSVKGNRSSPLSAHPFWTSYQNRTGRYGNPVNASHGVTWNRHAWNSARMDSAQINLHPINNGIPTDGSSWMTAYHESEFEAGYAAQDPTAGGRASLAVSRNVCFRVPADPSGTPKCDGSGAPLYPGVPTTTTEGTRILPDHLFTPGTHIEYFVRRTLLESPAVVHLQNDTLEVFPHETGFASSDYDGDRFQSVDVLPDMWKSSRYNGSGLACMLIVDGQDRRGSELAFMGAADSLCYGKNNGAKKGWKAVGASYLDPNDPSGFVAANLGQAGLNFDLFETRAAESMEAGHLGVRDALNSTWAAADRSGPSQDMLDNLYSTVLYIAGDLDQATLADHDANEGGNDVQILRNFLDAGTLASPKRVWLSGDGIVEDAYLHTTGADPLDAFLAARMGVGGLASGDLNTYYGTNSAPPLTGLIPTAPWFAPAGMVLGNANLCTVSEDVLIAAGNGAVAASYEAIGPGPQGFIASVYRDVAGTPRYKTLVDGFDLKNLRGRYSSLAELQGGAFPGTSLGRHKWFDEVVTQHFAICSRRCPVVAVGDLPGHDGGGFANLNLGAFPNPAFASARVNLRLTLAKAQDLTVRIYNVAGREVRRFTAKGVEGENVLVWDGALSNGVRATPGVYFYRVDGVDFGAGSASSKLILLGATE